MTPKAQAGANGTRGHVVLVHRYFAPDTPPYAAILRDLAEHLGAEGFRVTVLTCQPSYNRDIVGRAARREVLSENVAVVRWPVLDDRNNSLRKVLNLVWFSVRLVLHAPRLGRVDALMAASTPPVFVAAIAARIARTKGAAFLYHKQDVYPEVTVGIGREAGRIARLLRMVDARTDRLARQVVVLSSDMAQTIEERGINRGRISVINNFDPWSVEPDPAVVGTSAVSDSELHIAFAGNLGRFQGLETLFPAIAELQADPIRFHFFGEGPLKAALENLMDSDQLENVEIYGYRHPSEVAKFLATQADLGIVSLAPGVIRAAYPSKTLSYLRQGTPILALVESDTELAGMVRNERVGLQIEPGDHHSLVALLRQLASDSDPLDGAPQRARQLYAERFDKPVRLQQWSALFEKVLA